MNFKAVYSVVERAIDRWATKEGYRLAASTAYYALFSIFPLLLLTVTVFGFFLGDAAVTRDQLLDGLGLTPDMRKLLEPALVNMQETGHVRGVAAVISVISLALGASGVFLELETAVRRIWDAPEPTSGPGVLGVVKTFLRDRLVGFLLLALVGATLIASLVFDAVLAKLGDALALRGGAPLLWGAVEIGASFAILTLVFAGMFRVLSRTRCPIRRLLPGAAITTLLLVLLKSVFAFYLQKLTSYSAYGVVGGVLALGAWIYLSAQLLLLGAALTHAIADPEATKAWAAPAPTPASPDLPDAARSSSAARPTAREPSSRGAIRTT